MTLQEIVKQYWVLGVMGLLSLVEISKIQINPWSAIFGWIGDRMMVGIKKDVNDLKKEVTSVKKDVAGLKTNVDELREEQAENEAVACRIRILRFADEVYQDNGKAHSKESFDQTLTDISKYKRYCKIHPEFKNEMTVIAAERIESVYKHCLENHCFL